MYEDMRLQKYGIEDELNQLVDNIDLSNLATIEIMSDETKDRLVDLRDSGLDNIDFDSYHNEVPVLY